MVYGELGRCPLDVIIKSRMVSYWGKLVTGNRNKLSYLFCSYLMKCFNDNSYKCPWLRSVKDTLDSTGNPNLFNMDFTTFNPKWLKLKVERTLRDQFIQRWFSGIDTSDLCTTYRSFKRNFEFEPYLIQLPESMRTFLCKFRVSNHKLPVETGRHARIVIPRYQRYCTLCNSEKLGDEYHLFFECTSPDIIALRNKYIPSFYLSRPSLSKLGSLFQNQKLQYKIALFVKNSGTVLPSFT